MVFIIYFTEFDRGFRLFFDWNRYIVAEQCLRIIFYYIRSDIHTRDVLRKTIYCILSFHVCEDVILLSNVPSEVIVSGNYRNLKNHV